MTLKEELQNAKYTGLTDQECYGLLTIKNITAKQSISSHDIQKYLALNNKLLPMEVSAIDSAVNANRMLEVFESFALDEVEVEVALIAILDGLILDGLIDANNKTAILAMGEKLISRAEELGLGVFGIGKVMEARS